MNPPILAVAAPAANAASGAHVPSDPRADALLAALFEAALGAAIAGASAEVEADGTAGVSLPTPADADPAAARARSDEPARMPSAEPGELVRDALIALAGLAMPAITVPASIESPPAADAASDDGRATGRVAPLVIERLQVADCDPDMPATTDPAPPTGVADRPPVPAGAPDTVKLAREPSTEHTIADRDAPTANDGSTTASTPVPVPASASPVGASTQTPPSVTITAPIDSAAFAPALADELVRLVQIRADRVELHVRPIELGPIDLSIRFDGREAHLVVHAVQPEARTALDNALPGLRTLLADAGIALGGASIHDGRASDGGGERSLRDDSTPSRRSAPAPAATAVWTRRTGAGVIDTYA